MERYGFACLRQGRRAKFVGAMMAENQVFDQNRELGRESRNRFDAVANHPYSQHDVAEQTPFGRVVDAARVAKLIDFTDVMEHDTSKEEVGVEVRIVLRDGAGKTDETDDV